MKIRSCILLLKDNVSDLNGLISLNEDLSIFYRSAGTAILFYFFPENFQVFGFSDKSTNSCYGFTAAVTGIQNDAQALFAWRQCF